MSIWADLEDRSSGDVIRKEDMQKTINDLTEEIKQLQEENRILSKQLDDFKRYYDFFHEQVAVWCEHNYEDDHKGISSFFKF